MSKKTDEVQQEVMAQIAEALRNGVVPWRQSWLSELPRNPITKRYYRGMNVLMLWVKQLKHQYDRQLWASYRQWGGAGAQVKEGEKGTPIVFFKMSEYPDRENPGEKYKVPTYRLSYVFNVAQVKDWPPPTPPEFVSIEERHRRAQVVVDAKGVSCFPGDPAYFYALDKITMPSIVSFETADDYYRTLFHELGHWTGHPSRLNRPTLYDKKEIADKTVEELTAEFCSAFLATRLGLAQGKQDNSAAYILNWLSHVPAEHHARLIFKGASLGAKAMEYIMPLEEETVAEPELEAA
jgi:antirestriction protein ArdC